MILMTILLILPFGDPPSFEQVLARNAQAQGLKADALKIQLHITEPSFEGELVYWAARPDMVRVELTIDGEIVFEEGYGGDRGWQRQAGGPVTPASDAGRQALRNGALQNLYPLAQLAEFGFTIAPDPDSPFGVRLKQPDGHEVWLGLDPETYLVVTKRDVRALHPDVDPSKKTIETRYSSFKTFGSRTLATRLVARELGSGSVVQTTQILDVQELESIDPGFFARPTD